MTDITAKIFRRVQQLIGFATTKTTANDAGNVQTVQVRLNDIDTREPVPLVYFFGFSSSPPEGSEVALISLHGDPANAIGVASNNQPLRPRNLQPGESIFYDSLGRSVKLSASGGIVIEAASSQVTVSDATVVTINAATDVVMNTPLLKVSGDIVDNYNTNTRTMAGMRSTYNTHTHTDPQGGSTGTPSPTM